MEDNNYIGNISTIIKTFCLWIAGYAIGYFLSIGLNLPISQEQLAEMFFIIICTIIAYIDAKNPNSYNILGNNKTNPPTEQQLVLKEIVLNEEYETTDEEDDGGNDGC